MANAAKKILAILMVITCIAAGIIVGGGSEANAKTQKYYSPKQIGMKKYDTFTGKNAFCIRSIKGNKLIYSKSYRVTDADSTYLTYNKKKLKAKITKKTKYFIGNTAKINLEKKNYDHNSKWLKKVSKKKFMKKFAKSSRPSAWDRILIKNGKVKAVAINCKSAN